MSATRIEPAAFPRVLRAACLFALAALGLMIWSLFDPHPLAVLVAMSVGQALGTLSLAAYLLVVVADLRRNQVRSAAEARRVPPAA